MKDKIKCPKCGFEQTPTDSCLKCGIIFSKYQSAPANKQTLSKIEQRLEQSLDRYFTTSVAEDEREAILNFQQTQKRCLIVLFVAIFSSMLGFYFIFFTQSTTAFYTGISMLFGGMVLGIVGAFLLYRCPVCGLQLMLSPSDPNYSGRNTGIRVYPPPDSCPNCDTPLR